mgnify:CR=1 FL=1
MNKIYLWIKSLFTKKNKLFIKKNPIEFADNGVWGNTIQIDKTDNYHYIKGHGFLPTYLFQYFPEKGDFFIVDMASGKKAIYVFTEIKRCSDPKDMFFYNAEFLRYKEDENEKNLRNMR